MKHIFLFIDATARWGNVFKLMYYSSATMEIFFPPKIEVGKMYQEGIFRWEAIFLHKNEDKSFPQEKLKKRVLYYYYFM